MNDTTFQGNGIVKYVPVVVDAKQKPITNAMKIRAMTDEELAETGGADLKIHILGMSGRSTKARKRTMNFSRAVTVTPTGRGG